MELVTLADIAEMLDMTRQGVDLLVKREVDFPEPVAISGPQKVRSWKRADVERWARKSGRLK